MSNWKFKQGDKIRNTKSGETYRVMALVDYGSSVSLYRLFKHDRTFPSDKQMTLFDRTSIEDDYEKIENERFQK